MLLLKLSFGNLVNTYSYVSTFEYDCRADEPFAEIASLELELESTDRLSQNALSLSGLSIRFTLVLATGLLGTDPFVGDATLDGIF